MTGLVFDIPDKKPRVPGLIYHDDLGETVIWFPEAEGLYISAMDFTPRFCESLVELKPLPGHFRIVEVPFSEVAQLYCQAKGHSERIVHTHGCGTVDNPAMAVWRNTGCMGG
jgi:hypothetical protein